MDTTRIRAIVQGRVQGVSYRFHTTEEAERLGLVGWVRNLADGSVEVEAEGDRGNVEALVEWLRKGPPAARVTAVDASFVQPHGGERGFLIR